MRKGYIFYYYLILVVRQGQREGGREVRERRRKGRWEEGTDGAREGREKTSRIYPKVLTLLYFFTKVLYILS